MWNAGSVCVPAGSKTSTRPTLRSLPRLSNQRSDFLQIAIPYMPFIAPDPAPPRRRGVGVCANNETQRDPVPRLTSEAHAAVLAANERLERREQNRRVRANWS